MVPMSVVNYSIFNNMHFSSNIIIVCEVNRLNLILIAYLSVYISQSIRFNKKVKFCHSKLPARKQFKFTFHRAFDAPKSMDTLTRMNEHFKDQKNGIGNFLIKTYGGMLSDFIRFFRKYQMSLT